MIEVGEYVRTDNGIDKFLYKTKYDNGVNKYVFEKTWMSNPEYYILKHSKNIIDLIEVGDYVNGQKVIEVDNCKGAMREVYVEGQNSEEDCGLYFEQIETVVTKEQFKNIEYRLED